MTRFRYLSGLNTLRFFAAFFVIIGHAQLSLAKLGIADGSGYTFLTRGGDAVEFFFTLSGFLITYLLLNEIEKTKTVSIRDFYLRRVFRIWPLYFLIVLAGFIFLGAVYPKLYHQRYFTFPSTWEGIALFVFFLPNYAAQNYPVGFMFPLWSIGVEEQFYLFWAPLLKKLKNHILVCVLLFAVISTLVYTLIFFSVLKVPDRIYGTLKFFKVHHMAIGCLFSYVLYEYYPQYNRSVFARPVSQIIVWAIILYHYLIGFVFSENLFFHILLSFFYGFLILNVSVIKNRLVNIEKRPFVFLGAISYGLYMYHMLVDYLLRLLYGSKLMAGLPASLKVASYYVFLILITILVASFSYNYFEKFFINLKSRYEKV